jgi:phosphatidate cytidylyltransferase
LEQTKNKGSKKMNLKRLLTGIIGFPIVLAVLVLGNKYIIDCLMAVVSIFAIYEYAKCAKHKDINIITWLAYVSSLVIAVLHVFPTEFILLIISILFPLLIFILFLHVIITNMKITFKDIVYTLFGIAYIVGFLMFFALLYGSDFLPWSLTGKIAIWYVFFSAWGTDTVAYLVGKHLGKHKFSKVSPNKTIEGCIGGTVGAVVGGVIFTYFINLYLGTEVPLVPAGIIIAILSIVGQFGDFSASVVKRAFEVKDFSELFPGHGGMIDRIDSVMFIAPFAYVIFTVISLVI